MAIRVLILECKKMFDTKVDAKYALQMKNLLLLSTNLEAGLNPERQRKRCNQLGVSKNLTIIT